MSCVHVFFSFSRGAAVHIRRIRALFLDSGLCVDYIVRFLFAVSCNGLESIVLFRPKNASPAWCVVIILHLVCTEHIPCDDERPTHSIFTILHDRLGLGSSEKSVPLAVLNVAGTDWDDTPYGSMSDTTIAADC